MDLSLSLTPLLLHQTTIELGSKKKGIVPRMYCVQRLLQLERHLRKELLKLKKDI